MSAAANASVPVDAVDFELRQAANHLKVAQDVFGWLRELSAVTKDTLDGVGLPAGPLREMRAAVLADICEYLASVYANEMDCIRAQIEKEVLPGLTAGKAAAGALPATRGGAR